MKKKYHAKGSHLKKGVLLLKQNSFVVVIIDINLKASLNSLLS